MSKKSDAFILEQKKELKTTYKMTLIKYITLILFIVSFGSILTGYFTESEYAQKLIGFGVLGLFFIVFPLFSYYRWKDKNINDYMLTKENLDKMRETQKHNHN